MPILVHDKYVLCWCPPPSWMSPVCISRFTGCGEGLALNLLANESYFELILREVYLCLC